MAIPYGYSEYVIESFDHMIFIYIYSEESLSLSHVTDESVSQCQCNKICNGQMFLRTKMYYRIYGNKQIKQSVFNESPSHFEGM